MATTAQPKVSGRYLSLTSYKRDGTPVATPVWFVEEAGRYLVETDATSFKVRRVRHDPRVVVATCTVRGRVTGEPVPGRAEVLHQPETGHVEAMFGRKYRGELGLARTWWRIKTALHLGRPRGERVILAVTPD